MTDTTPSTAPLSPEREAEIRETPLGDWYAGPWYSEYVEGQGGEPASYRVVHRESGTVLATLPDWAGPIALLLADAHDAVPELLAELDRVRAELKKACADRKWHHERRVEAYAELYTAQAAEPRATEAAVLQARRAIHAANSGPVPANEVTEGGDR